MSKYWGKVVIIVQARMGSVRLPGKSLLKILDRPLLSYLIERLKYVQLADDIVIATTLNPLDRQIENFCKNQGINVFKGSENDVLDRYLQAAEAYHAKHIVRITADCPLIDPSIVDHVIQFYLKALPKYDYVSNSLKRTYPRGLDVEIFSLKSLKDACQNAKLQPEREHVTLYFYEHPETYCLGSVTQQIDQSHHRWTVDTAEDFQLIEKIISTLYPLNSLFLQNEILHEFDKHPDWIKINAHVEQKPLKISFLNINETHS